MTPFALSGKQIAAAEIVHRHHDALEVVPPDPRVKIADGLHDRLLQRTYRHDVANLRRAKYT